MLKINLGNLVLAFFNRLITVARGILTAFLLIGGLLLVIVYKAEHNYITITAVACQIFIWLGAAYAVWLDNRNTTKEQQTKPVLKCPDCGKEVSLIATSGKFKLKSLNGTHEET